MAHDYKLDQVFVHKTTTHEFCIRWTRLGNVDAPALVFIHGTPWSSTEWHDLAAAFATHYSIYIYDHPGFGASPSPRRLVDAADQEQVDLDGSLRLRAQASAALLDHWHLTIPPHIVAHDNAGLVSLRLLLQHGIKFASLCFIDVVAIGPFGLPFFNLVAQNESVFTSLPSNFIEGLLRAYVRNASFKLMPPETEDKLCGPWLAGGTQGPQRFLKEIIQAHNRDITVVEQEYARVGGLTPTKIIWGRDDAWLPVETASRLKNALNVEEPVVIIDDAGHLVQLDQPSRLALEVGLWLNKHSNNPVNRTHSYS